MVSLRMEPLACKLTGVPRMEPLACKLTGVPRMGPSSMGPPAYRPIGALCECGCSLIDRHHFCTNRTSCL